MYKPTGILDRDTAIERYSPLVKRMAHYMLAKLPPSVQLDDIIQAGLIGLMDAINRFQENQGTQFETYATQRIRGAILDELRSNDWLPRGLRRSLREIEGAISKLEQRLKRPPTEREMAKEMGVSLREYQHLLQEARGYQLFHIEDFASGDEDGFLDRNCPDAQANPLERLQDERLREALVQAIEQLPDRERLLMSLYYDKELNFREIASVLDVSESRICQLHSQAVARLRVKIRDWI
jgi:RNA polymerase sigma factor for flagellar operon FliA